MDGTQTLNARERVLQKAIETWGEDAQIDESIVKMADLTKAVIKLRRMDDGLCTVNEFAEGYADIKEAMADVQIALDYMRLIYGETADLEADKIERINCKIRNLPWTRCARAITGGLAAGFDACADSLSNLSAAAAEAAEAETKEARKMARRKKKCARCGRKFPLDKSAVYISEERKGITHAIKEGAQQFDSMDCPHCGCQNVLGVRHPKVSPKAPETPTQETAEEASDDE